MPAFNPLHLGLTAAEVAAEHLRTAHGAVVRPAGGQWLIAFAGLVNPYAGGSLLFSCTTQELVTASSLTDPVRWLAERHAQPPPPDPSSFGGSDPFQSVPLPATP